MDVAPASLRGLPFPQQIAAIDAAIAAGDGAALLGELVSFTDHQPLAYTLAELATRGQLERLSDERAASIVALPDTSLRRVLAALQDATVPEAVAAPIAAAALTLTVERVAAAALIDRWLKNNAANIRRAQVKDAASRIELLLNRDHAEDISDADLFRVPGSRHAELDELALSAGASAAWKARVARFAADVLTALESQPKSLSQANAEELLAKQVYTEPGHFLMELLQNADDAGATTWSVRIFADRIEIEHNGVPFDARDVVGILSIGQSTKSKQQIGFFGVGFKSVYAICERPQIYSGPFSFEIANVSVPRRLAARSGATSANTLLVLPLRATVKTDYLFDRLASLPAEVLLTLNSLRALEVSYADRRHSVSVKESAHGRVELCEMDAARQFLVARDEALYSGDRAANRTQTTPLLVAVPLDNRGAPTSIGRRPTVYSYLPTGERSGLHFLIHAHFDVPVDRERLDLSSRWNQWAIGEMGPLLAQALGRLVDEWKAAPQSSEANVRLDGILEIVPLARELGAEPFGVLANSLVGVAFLPGAHGERHSGAHALLSDDTQLTSALGGVDIGGRRLLRSLESRHREVAESLGAKTLTSEAIVGLLAEDAASRTPGETYDPPWADKFADVAAALAATNAGLTSLEAATCLPDSAMLARSPGEIRRAEGELRALLGAVTPLLHPSLEAPRCRAFLEQLSVASASTRDLVAVLTSRADALTIIGAVGVDRVLSHLANAEPKELSDAFLAYASPTDRGQLAPIGGAFVTGASALAELIRAAPVRPPLVATEVEAARADELTLLGAPRLELTTALELIANDELCFANDQTVSLHRAINEQRDSISPALARRLAAAPIFTASDGTVNSLVGDGRTEIPEDDDIRDIWPDHRWLSGPLAAFEYIGDLGVAAVGAKAMAEELLAGSASTEQRRAAFVYLAKHPEKLSAETVAALANARLWPDANGELRCLSDLREPSEHPAVARLYAAWPRAFAIEVGNTPGTAIHLAKALDLDHHVAAPTLVSALDEIAVTTFFSELEDPNVFDAVVELLNAAASQVPRAALERVCAAPIFRCTDDERRPLGDWQRPTVQHGHHVSPTLRPAFERSRFPILAQRDADRLAPFISGLQLSPGSGADLVHAIAGADDALDEATASAVRRALIASSGELAARASELAPPLSRLPIWPTGLGLRAASTVVTRRALEMVVGGTTSEWEDILRDDGLAQVSEHASAEADALREVVEFVDVDAAVAAAISRVAIADAPLAEQPWLLGTRERVAAIAIAIARGNVMAWNLPISLRCNGTLAAAPLLVATEDEIEFLGELPLTSHLADVRWAAAVRAALPSALEDVDHRQIIAAIHAASREPCQAASHTCLNTRERRARFYAWLIAHRDAIVGDDQSLGPLGRSCVIASQAGMLRSPRELLFDSHLPDLGIDWNPSDEVPSDLATLLRRSFQPASKQLKPLVDHLLSAQEQAISQRDSPRLAELIGHLARVLAGADDKTLERRVRQFQLRKRLRIETTEGNYERARTLLAPDAHHNDLIARFADAPPPAVATRYARLDVLRLFRAAGSKRQLSGDALRAFIAGTNRKPGADATVALACYIAIAADNDASLRRELDLGKRAWIADRAGEPRVPRELYWPDDDVHALIGNAANRLLDAEVAHRAPSALRWSGVRSADNVELLDVASHIEELAQGGEPIDEAALAWLDAGLSQGALDPGLVRKALSERRVFEDDRGALRRAGELVVEGSDRLFGDYRGDFSLGTRLPRLMSALRISLRPGKRDVTSFFQQIVSSSSFDDAVSACDVALADCIRRCIDLLVLEGGRGPAVLPVACRGPNGTCIALLPEAAGRVALASDERQLELTVVLSDGADAQWWRRYLASYGVGDAGSIDDADAEARPNAVSPAEQASTDTDKASSERPDRAQAQARPSAEEGDDESRGVIDRLRRWLRGDDEDHDDNADDDDHKQRRDENDKRKPERNKTPSRRNQRASQPRGSQGDNGSASAPPSGAEPDDVFRPVDQRAWFSNQDQLHSQLSSNPAWLADRTQVAEFGFAHAPTALPLPYRYAPRAIFAGFDRRRQTWRHIDYRDEWSSGGPIAGRVELRGRLPAGEAIIPVPLYGRVSSHGGGENTRVVETEGATFAISKRDCEIAIDIALHRGPEFSGAARVVKPPKSLTETTASAQELPVEVHDLVASLAAERDALVIAETVQSFVRERYIYDPTYLENAEVALWLKQRTRKRSNVHIAALHAGRDTDTLGRGVCYELNALVCEMMRRCNVACAVATGWTFQRGSIDEPDHLWAMALIDAGSGPRWLPIDASTTRTGRALHAANRPPGPWRASGRGTKSPREPDWTKRTPKRSAAPSLPISDLLRVARYIERTTGANLGNRDTLLAACRAVLADADRAGKLGELIALSGADSDKPQ